MPPHKTEPVVPMKRPAEYTSLASRKRRAPSCSMKSLEDLEDEEGLEEAFIGYFNKTSENHFTWGKTQNLPITAIKKKGTNKRLCRMNVGSSIGIAMLLGGSKRVEELKLPNSPERSFFLRFSLDIRERVYNLFFDYRSSIIVKYDLGQVESLNLRCHPILRVCKQISDEASRYLYQHNVFRAVLREPRVTYHLNESFMIAPAFLSFIRNFIIECNVDNHCTIWYERAANCLEKLAGANTALHSLTLVIVPQRLLSANNARSEQGIITFSDFLHARGRFMQAFKNLPCKTFNIVVKKHRRLETPKITLVPIDVLAIDVVAPGEVLVLQQAQKITVTKRFLMSVDLTYLRPGKQQLGPLQNEETVRMEKEKRMRVAKQMGALRRNLENVVIDHERAMGDGICRELREEERIADGRALALRTK
ncbi:hypothetical protein B0O99DRAFT_592010 [Bisporella sp. PMI_857]|nr:hypothetical protein B0O99DRAFT_592010 [Bisporella sp. PMI_857]